MGKEEKDIREASWHDGRFVGFSTVSTNGVVDGELEVDLYLPDTARKRERVRLVFTQVRDLAVSLDAHELRDNEKAGNISGARFGRSGKDQTIEVSLSGGSVHVRAAQISVSTTTEGA